MTLVQGQIIQGRYRIVGLIAQGGFGAVYKGWDVNLNRPIAIKENLDTSPEAQRQFMHEAQILSNLSHPSLPRVTDNFLAPGEGQYLVMDFIEGEDLQQMLDRQGQPFTETQVLPWIEQVCDALEYLHQQTPPIIHRDIKPANIKITPEGRAVLVDFGISKVLNTSARTTLGARAVTPGYSAPEQYGRGTTDQRSDVYSLGATLYTLLTGQELPESIERLTNDAPLTAPRQVVPAISPNVESAILMACEPITTRRLSSVQAFRQSLTSQIGVPANYPSAGNTKLPPDATAGQSSAVNRSWVIVGSLLAVAIVVAALILRGAPTAAAPEATVAALTVVLPPATDEPTATSTTVPTARPTATSTDLPRPTATSTPIYPPLESFTGVWQNVDKNTGSWTFIEVTKQSKVVIAHFWGSCEPTDCDAGITSGIYEGNPVSLAKDQSFATYKFTLRLEEGVLHVTTFTHFTDNSGRKDKVTEDYFRKSSTTSSLAATSRSQPTTKPTATRQPTSQPKAVSVPAGSIVFVIKNSSSVGVRVRMWGPSEQNLDIAPGKTFNYQIPSGSYGWNIFGNNCEFAQSDLWVMNSGKYRLDIVSSPSQCAFGIRFPYKIG